MKLLLATDKVKIYDRDRQGRTPLPWAVGNGYEVVVKVLLATSKVKINKKDI